MIPHMKRMAAFVFAVCMMASSCSETKTNTQEKTEINKMDSTSKVLKENKEKLDEQTKKVEESLEKLDKEFETKD
jgi:predicted solute-binding protein